MPVQSAITSELVAIDGTPVVVVFFSIPVARPDSAVPLILPTVTATAPAEVVASPVSAGICAAARVPELTSLAAMDLLVSVCVAAIAATVSVAAGKVMVKLLAPALAEVKVVVPVDEPSSRKSEFVNVLAAVNVCAWFKMSAVPLTEGIVTPLIVVAVAAPKTGVTSVGVFAKTAAPVPVSSVSAAIRFALLGVASHVPTPVPRPVMPATGAAVAVMAPEPVAAILAPVPTTMAAVVLVLPVRALNAVAPVAEAVMV